MARNATKNNIARERVSGRLDFWLCSDLVLVVLLPSEQCANKHQASPRSTTSDSKTRTKKHHKTVCYYLLLHRLTFFTDFSLLKRLRNTKLGLENTSQTSIKGVTRMNRLSYQHAIWLAKETIDCWLAWPTNRKPFAGQDVKILLQNTHWTLRTLRNRFENFRVIHATTSLLNFLRMLNFPKKYLNGKKFVLLASRDGFVL